MFGDPTCSACGSDYNVNSESGLCEDCSAMEKVESGTEEGSEEKEEI